MCVYDRIKESVRLENSSEIIKSRLSLTPARLRKSPCPGGPGHQAADVVIEPVPRMSQGAFLTPSPLFSLAVCCHLAEIFLLLLESAPDPEPESCQGSRQVRGNKC